MTLNFWCTPIQRFITKVNSLVISYILRIFTFRNIILTVVFYISNYIKDMSYSNLISSTLLYSCLYTLMSYKNITGIGYSLLSELKDSPKRNFFFPPPIVYHSLRKDKMIRIECLKEWLGLLYYLVYRSREGNIIEIYESIWK